MGQRIHADCREGPDMTENLGTRYDGFARKKRRATSSEKKFGTIPYDARLHHAEAYK